MIKDRSRIVPVLTRRFNEGTDVPGVMVNKRTFLDVSGFIVNKSESRSTLAMDELRSASGKNPTSFSAFCLAMARLLEM